MPLLDHFAPPLKVTRFWHSFHNAWATFIASSLNEQLPPRYFAAPNVQFGIEIDVATYDEGGEQNGHSVPSAAIWSVPEPVQTIPFTVTTDIVEIEIFDTREGPELVAAVELVSPSNKDRPVSRSAFAAKCQSYLQAGDGLAIVDLVTDRTANLHDELIARLGSSQRPWNVPIYAAAYRPVERDGEACLDIWREELAVGKALPSIPLWLRGALCMRLDLEQTYARTCKEQRVG